MFGTGLYPIYNPGWLETSRAGPGLRMPHGTGNASAVNSTLAIFLSVLTDGAPRSRGNTGKAWKTTALGLLCPGLKYPGNP